MISPHVIPGATRIPPCTIRYNMPKEINTKNHAITDNIRYEIFIQLNQSNLNSPKKPRYHSHTHRAQNMIKKYSLISPSHLPNFSKHSWTPRTSSQSITRVQLSTCAKKASDIPYLQTFSQYQSNTSDLKLKNKHWNKHSTKPSTNTNPRRSKYWMFSHRLPRVGRSS